MWVAAGIIQRSATRSISGVDALNLDTCND
jgi:hypothetical protein